MTKSVRVVPAILTADDRALKTMLRQAEGFTNYVQIDFMDGKFVPSHSVSCDTLLGVSTCLEWEAHLMVKQPENELGCLREAGAQGVVFHVEATESPDVVIKQAKQLNMRVGLALNPETAVSSVAPLIDQVDNVLLLTVHPGYYGSQFLPEVLPKIDQLRRLTPAVEVGVDGGIKEGNIFRIARLGVDTIYVGSAIFNQPAPDQAYMRLQSLARDS